jgi:hypothetical protein
VGFEEEGIAGFLTESEMEMGVSAHLVR